MMRLKVFLLICLFNSSIISIFGAPKNHLEILISESKFLELISEVESSADANTISVSSMADLLLKNEKDIFIKLMRSGYDVNKTNMAGQSSMFDVFLTFDKKFIREVIESGGDIHIIDDLGYSVIDIALDKYMLGVLNSELDIELNEIMELCETFELDLNRKNQNGYNCLMKILTDEFFLAMSFSKKKEIISALRNFGADFNTIDNKGNNSLFYIFFAGDPLLLKTLVENGTEINHMNEDGIDALTVFMMEKYKPFFVMDKDNAGLYSMDSKEFFHFIKDAIKLGQTLSNENQTGSLIAFWSLFEYKNESIKILKYLKRRGVDLDVVIDGLTLLEVAEAYEYDKIVRYLK